MGTVSGYPAGNRGRQGNRIVGVDASGNVKLFGEDGDIYTGVVANRCQVLDKLDTAARQAMCRTRHRSSQYLTSIRLVLPNWYVSAVASTGGEKGTGGTLTVEASIEYPKGTYTRVTFSGANQGTIANGAQIVSDLVTVNIPDRTPFWVRMWISSSVGLPWMQINTDWTR